MSTDRKTNRLTLAEQAESSLREEIYTGQLVGGAKINIDEAAARLGMSQIPVREALRALSAAGLVEFVPQHGYTVRVASLDDFLDTYTLRQVLDPLAIELSVPLLDEADLQRAEHALTQLNSAFADEGGTQHRRWHREFHFALYSKCGSSWLWRMLEMLWENSERYQRLSGVYRGSSSARLAEHERILAAAKARDAAGAAQATLEHILLTRSVIEKVLGDAPGTG